MLRSESRPMYMHSMFFIFPGWMDCPRLGVSETGLQCPCSVPTDGQTENTNPE